MDASRSERNGEVSEWLKEHAWKVCKRVKPLRGFDKFVGNEFGQRSWPERSEGESQDETSNPAQS